MYTKMCYFVGCWNDKKAVENGKNPYFYGTFFGYDDNFCVKKLAD